MGKYFTVTVKPTITASEQHDGAFADADVLFDWTSFDIPKGAARLVGVTALVRGIDGADQAGAFDFELFFAKDTVGSTSAATPGLSAPTTLGDLNEAVDTSGWQNHVIGRTLIDASADSNDGVLVYMNVMTTALDGRAVVLQGEPDSGSNVGYDKLYVAGIAKAAFNFSTTVLARGGEAAGVTVVETDAGSDDDPNAELVFVPGDVLHSATDDVLGTVKSIAAFGSSKQDGSTY